MAQPKDQILTKPEDELVKFIHEHLSKWKDDMRSNYYQDWDRYERLWLGIYDIGDRERLSERSRLISPDTQQAIETYEAEMVEAVFGGDKWFDIDDDIQEQDQEKRIQMELTKLTLTEDFKLDKVTQAIKDCITYAAVYGKGIGEIIHSEKTVLKAVSRPVGDGSVIQGGTAPIDRFSVRLKPVHPKNFFIDPAASSIEDAMGCAIVEMVSAHQVIRQQQKKVYRDVPIYSHQPDTNEHVLDQATFHQRDGMVKLTKYYGLVPRKWLIKIKDSNTTPSDADKLDKALGVSDPSNEFEDYADMVEAVVVIANDVTLLKAEENRYMMKDRPVVAYDCDPIPGKFWGRGIAQKGLMMQSAIDAELRMHMDSKALTAAPMMAMDATRLPRGFQFNVQPGRSVKVNGNPAEVFTPFKFGETDSISLETMQVLQQKFLQATGTLDAAGMAAEGGTAGANTGISLALSGIIKKNRRSLMNFTSGFLIPFVEKAAWRYMQFDPERYQVTDYKFIPMSTLGMIAREYEQQHLMAVMSTLGPDSPLVPMLMMKYIENSGLTNKQEFIAQLQELMKPDPEKEQMAKQEQEWTVKGVQADIAAKQAQSEVDMAKAADLKETTRLREMEIRAQMMGSMSRNTEEGAEFEQRIQAATLALKEYQIDADREDSVRNHQIVREQMATQKEIAQMKPKQSSGG